MAPKKTHPVIHVPAPLVAVYENLAWNKAVIDRAKASIARAEVVLSESLTPDLRIEDTAQPRFVTARRIPEGVKRKTKPTARETLVRDHPALAASCVTTIVPVRRSAVTFVTGGWADYTTALDPLPVPVFTPRSPWAVVDFIGQGKEQITANERAGEALRDEIDALLDEHTLRPAGTVLHECGRGRMYRVAPTKITHRLNPAALAKADPALYLALTTEVSTPARIELVIGKVTPDAFDLDADLST